MSSNVTVMEDGGIFGVLKAIDRGDLVLELEEQCKALVDAIKDTGKGGKLTLEIEIKPDKKADIVRVSGQVKAKMPKRESKEAFFFMTVEGNLSRFDTRQQEMFNNTNRY